MVSNKSIIPIGKIEERILLIRGEKVVLDADLAEFYGVPTKRLNEQLKRNRERFPQDFVFQWTAEEKAEVVANCDHLTNLKYSRSLPFAFTEHGTMKGSGLRICIPMFLYKIRNRCKRNLKEYYPIWKLRITEKKRRHHFDYQFCF